MRLKGKTEAADALQVLATRRRELPLSLITERPLRKALRMPRKTKTTLREEVRGQIDEQLRKRRRRAFRGRVAVDLELLRQSGPPRWHRVSQRLCLSCHFNGVGVAQLVRRKAATDTGPARQAPELRSCRGSRPRPSRRGSVDHAEKRANRQLNPELQPGIKLLPSPTVHPNLAALATLAMADEHRSAPGLEVSLGERQSLADPKTGSPEDYGEPSKAQSRRPLPGLAHHSDDLLHPRWIGGVAAPLVLRSATGVITGECGWRASTACGIKLSNGVHGLLLELA